MLHKHNMQDPELLAKAAEDRAKDRGVRNEVYIQDEIIGSLSLTIKELQRHIRDIEKKVEEEHTWAKDTYVSEESVDFMKGYAHACNILGTTTKIR